MDMNTDLMILVPTIFVFGVIFFDCTITFTNFLFYTLHCQLLIKLIQCFLFIISPINMIELTYYVTMFV